jgi:uncharacterized protein (DUF362 family)
MGRVSRRTILTAGVAMAMTAGTGRATTSAVYLASTMDRAAAIRRGLQALGISFGSGKRVVIKPNFNSADPFPAATHPDTLAALVEHARAAGVSSITVADRSGMGNTRQVMERKGVFEQAKALDYTAVPLEELPLEAWSEERLPGGHWTRGVLFPRLFGEAELILQTCCLKTHRYGGHFTLSLKNSVGMVAKYHPRDQYNYMGELHGSPHQRRMIAEINQLYTPAVVVMDGLEAFTDGGPESGTLVKPGVILLSADRVAVDAVGVAILRMHKTNATVSGGRIFAQEQIARAVELGLGVTGPEQIELVAEDAEGRALADRIRGVLLKG